MRVGIVLVDREHVADLGFAGLRQVQVDVLVHAGLRGAFFGAAQIGPIVKFPSIPQVHGKVVDHDRLGGGRQRVDAAAVQASALGGVGHDTGDGHGSHAASFTTTI